MINDAATSSQPEDIFVDIFSQVFGFEKAQLLVPELDYQDFIGNGRRIDYALKTTDGRVAFEIDGPLHYHPDKITMLQYEDDLLRQNSLIHDGWRVFRWTDRQLAEEPEQVKEQLALFLASIAGLLEFDDFLQSSSERSWNSARTSKMPLTGLIACARMARPSRC